MKNKDLKSQLSTLNIGDLICVEWCDASVGNSRGTGTSIDVSVKSWGIFIGVLGEKAKHIMLAQNSFRYSDGLFDLDYTAIPLGWTANIAVISKEHIPGDLASKLVNSFLEGGHARTIKRPRTAQRRLRIHGRPD